MYIIACFEINIIQATGHERRVISYYILENFRSVRRGPHTFGSYYASWHIKKYLLYTSTELKYGIDQKPGSVGRRELLERIRYLDIEVRRANRESHRDLRNYDTCHVARLVC